jgi:stage V sporulation protein R
MCWATPTFAKNNQLFTRFMAMAGSHILEQSAARANRLERALTAHGQERVEAVLDAALALETHIDVNQPLHRPRYPEFVAAPGEPAPDPFRHRFARLPGETAARPARRRQRDPGAQPLPPQAESTCCGLSRTTRPSWKTGSAISSWPCAKKPTISIRSSPARS